MEGADVENVDGKAVFGPKSLTGVWVRSPFQEIPSGQE